MTENIPAKLMTLRNNYTLGTDPEMFIFANGKLLPAFKFLPSKREQRGGIYWDGFQAEWKFDGAWKCQNNLVLYNRQKLIRLNQIAKTYNENARLTIRSVVKIPKEVLAKANYNHVELGCEPSFNIYNLKGKAVSNPRLLPYRFAGGHMHFGTWYVEKPDYERIVKTLDAVLGIWAVGAAQNLDSPIRREYYGLAGEYRTPTYEDDGYGVEYRTLSNFWLAAPAITQITWEIGRMAVRLSRSKFRKFWIAPEKEVIETIQNGDVKMAARILNRNKDMFHYLLGHKLYMGPKHIRLAHEVGQYGIEHVIKDPNAISANWHFGAEWIPNGGQPWSRWTTYVDNKDL